MMCFDVLVAELMSESMTELMSDLATHTNVDLFHMYEFLFTDTLGR